MGNLPLEMCFFFQFWGATKNQLQIINSRFFPNRGQAEVIFDGVEVRNHELMETGKKWGKVFFFFLRQKIRRFISKMFVLVWNDIHKTSKKHVSKIQNHWVLRHDLEDWYYILGTSFPETCQMKRKMLLWSWFWLAVCLGSFCWHMERDGFLFNIFLGHVASPTVREKVLRSQASARFTAKNFCSWTGSVSDVFAGWQPKKAAPKKRDSGLEHQTSRCVGRTMLC